MQEHDLYFIRIYIYILYHVYFLFDFELLLTSLFAGSTRYNLGPMNQLTGLNLSKFNCLKMAFTLTLHLGHYFLDQLTLPFAILFRLDSVHKKKVSPLQCSGSGIESGSTGSTCLSASQRYGSGSGSFYHQAKIVRKP